MKQIFALWWVLQFPLAAAAGEGAKLSKLTQTLALSFNEIAKSTVKPKALLYRQAAKQLEKRAELPTIAGLTDTLCANRLMLEITAPVIDGTSSTKFAAISRRMEQLQKLLQDSTKEMCQEHTRWSLETILQLTHSALEGLAMVGFAEEDLPRAADFRVHLGNALTDPASPTVISELLDSYIQIKSALESFYEAPLVDRLAILIGSMMERLRGFVGTGAEVSTPSAATTDLAHFRPAQELVLAARLTSAVPILEAPEPSELKPLTGGITPPPVARVEKSEMDFEFLAFEPKAYVQGNRPHSIYDNEKNKNAAYKVDEPFEIQTTEVTQRVFGKYSKRKPSKGDNELLPVTNVSYLDVKEFIDTVNRTINDGYTYRLPTVDEWRLALDYAQFSWLFEMEARSNHFFDHYAWYGNNAKSLQPVRTRRPNTHGMYDLLGNASEFVDGGFPGRVVYARKEITGNRIKMHIGGCYTTNYDWLYSSGTIPDDERQPHLGFRLARTRKQP